MIVVCIEYTYYVSVQSFHHQHIVHVSEFRLCTYWDSKSGLELRDTVETPTLRLSVLFIDPGP